MEEALAELRELSELSNLYREVSEAFQRLIDGDAVLCYIDHLTTEATGDTVYHYKLAEPLKACLTAIRAGNFQPHEGWRKA